MNIATLANQQKKPTKNQAFAIVKDLERIYPDLQDNLDMAKLYAYFMPSVPKKAKTPFQWVAKAMADKDVRYYLNYVYVTDKVIVATDGHRLHIVDNLDHMEPGFYNKAGDKVKDSDFVRFPEYEHIIPSIEGIQPITGSIDLFEVIEHDGLLCRIIPDKEPVYVQKKYLDDAANNGEITVYPTGKSGAVRIYSDFGEAIIMPVKS